MSLTSVGPFLWPSPMRTPAANTSYLIDAAGEKVAWRVQAGKTGSLGKVKFRLGTVTTGDTLKVSFQDVDAATGDPDGTPDQYRTIVVANSDDDRWVTTGLLTADGTDTGAKRSVTKGDWFFVVIEFNSYVAGSINVQSSTPINVQGNAGYGDHYTSSWTKNVTNFNGIVYYDDDSLAFSPQQQPGIFTSSGSYNTGTTPDEVALKFSCPVEVSCSGAWMQVDMDGDCNVVLYDSDGSTVLRSASFDKDPRGDTAVRQIEALWSSPVTLAANTSYYLALKPTTATSLSTRYTVVPAAADMDAWEGGQSCIWSQRTDAGAWSDTATQRLKAAIMIDQIHGAGGGGGLLTHPGMAGGMRG